MRIRSQTAQSHIANSVGCILPPLIGALRNPASHLLLFPNKGYVKLSASTRAEQEDKAEGREIHARLQMSSSSQFQ